MRRAEKHNQGKTRYSLLSVPAIKQMADVMTIGAAKYGDRNWEIGRNFTDYYDAAQRHMQAWLNREDGDSESGINPLAHAACNLMFLLHFQSDPDRYGSFDDRPKPCAGQKKKQ
mgnify:CR=1 FL=1